MTQELDPAWIRSELDRLGVVLTIPPIGINRISNVLGQDVTRPPTDGQKERARNWWNSRLRLDIERVLGFGAYMAVYPFVRNYVGRIEKIDPEQSGLFQHEVALFCGETEISTPQAKIRTMRVGASAEETLFNTTFFISGMEVNDERVLPDEFVRWLRESGRDEWPQFRDLASGTKSLIGIRAMTLNEISGLRTIWLLRDNEALNLPAECRQVLEAYPRAVLAQNPQAGLFGIVNAIGSKNVPPMLRLLADKEFIYRNSLATSLRVFRYAMQSRVIEREGAR